LLRNLTNLIFTSLLFIIILISLWKNISNNGLDDRVGEPYSSPKITSTHILPLGTDDNGNDYLVKFSSAFRFNLLISTISSTVFIIVSIILGLGIGFKSDNITKSYKIFSINYIKILYFHFCSLITDIFQSIPILIVLLIGIIFFQSHLNNPNHSLFFTFLIIALFSSPKLSVVLGNHIKHLNREEFILATKASGVSMFTLIGKHILYYESKGIIVLQFINFFLFTIMIEIFLGFFGKGANGLSIGKLIGKDNFLFGAWTYLINPQQKFTLVFPLIFVLVLCLVIRWLAHRVIILTNN
jgi:peptide/nickel transport system permease protein